MLCGILEPRVDFRLCMNPLATTESCSRARYVSVLCELTSTSSHRLRQPVHLPVPGGSTQSRVPVVTCPLQHVTHPFLACDEASVCMGVDRSEGWYNNVCPSALGFRQPYFYCGAAGTFVPYSLLCDFRTDCTGGDDEDFCVHATCSGNRFNCGNYQCVDFSKQCDGFNDCVNTLDESDCPSKPPAINSIKPPAVVVFDSPGGFTVAPVHNGTTHCPETHFQCHDDGYCLPVYVRCNDIYDCPGQEDELWCHGYRCPGFYRCRGSEKTICVHVHHLCDGLPQCPRHDDELMCEVSCPESCVCHGLAFTCPHTFQVSSFPQLRYLEARGSGLRQSDISNSIMLIYLGVQACGWKKLAKFILPNIHSLDLASNLLTHVNFSHFEAMFHLRQLSLADNPIPNSIFSVQAAVSLPMLLYFNLSRLRVEDVNMDVLSASVPNLQVLDLSHAGIQSLLGRTLPHTLRVLNLLGSPIAEFTPDFLKTVSNLMHVSVDNFKLCCPAVLPDNFKGECLAPADEISSCDDLLKSNVYRFALTVFASLAIIGNMGSFLYRLCFSAQRNKTGFFVFVFHLCVSDFFMGIYLAFIGVADHIYAGAYVWSESRWKTSTVCKVAGLLSLLSSEVSAFLICIITLDRFLVLHFPFSQIRFGVTSAYIACIIIWTLGFVLATVPLLPLTSHWEFYTHTGLCIPLPITGAEFAGHLYSFSVMIVCNLLLFLLIAVGQFLIYWSVKTNVIPEQRKQTGNSSGEKVRSKDTVLARRLFTVAMSDFLCWFPIGLCGLLAAIDVVIPAEVNVAMAILVLPLNSALNPFLYTLNTLLEKRQNAEELRFQRMLHAHLKQRG